MVKRKHVGLFLESYNNLPAMVIYILNIVRTFTLIEDSRKPVLIILHRADSPIEELKQIGYPYIEFYQSKNTIPNLFQRGINKISRELVKRNLINLSDKKFPNNLDCIFPYSEKTECDYIKHKIIWKPDFQEFHYPIYFSPRDLEYDTLYLNRISKLRIDMVLSSYDSKRDYERFYPSHLNNLKVLNFTSFLPAFHHIDIKFLLNTYNLKKPYYLVANQFWPHKNHINVLKAMAILKRQRQNLPFQMVFTGKTSSTRDKDLKLKLDYFIKLNNLEEDIVYTGFIKREEQLCLMKNSISVVQPSLFEGWSTVIEDVKALNHRVIATNISVNKEQISENVYFFDPFNYEVLASILLDVYNNPKPIEVRDYSAEIFKFKEALEKVFEV
ncbi:MAG: glycosyltransferase [Sporocytophaga sp.]|uniref:glycosyltransferase n=1 Tax=Sporocytophaga sp. TaxID=2231183 RepID=UPI001B0919D8|nr:glycosyltransferase [Sporocytophaga sp.]MBO9701643.1 glycosyltransferase [Sporocytophaga sp.]